LNFNKHFPGLDGGGKVFKNWTLLFLKEIHVYVFRVLGMFGNSEEKKFCNFSDKSGEGLENYQILF
jgi:hypothetical protein